MHLVGFYYKNVSRCTVLWMSNSKVLEYFMYIAFYGYCCICLQILHFHLVAGCYGCIGREKKKERYCTFWDVNSTAMSCRVWCAVVCLVVRGEMCDACKGSPSETLKWEFLMVYCVLCGYNTFLVLCISRERFIWISPGTGFISFTDHVISTFTVLQGLLKWNNISRQSGNM